MLAIDGGALDYRNQTLFQRTRTPGLVNVVLVHPPMRVIGLANECGAFLGGRTSAGGNTRLIVVSTHNGFADEEGVHRWVPLTHLVGTPATSNPASRITFQSFPPLHVRLTMTDRLRLFAGQPDPNDPSHFTIGYELNDVPGTIDGWLQDDDRLKFEYRDGPATTRPTAYQF